MPCAMKGRGCRWGLGAETKVPVVFLNSFAIGVTAGEEMEAVIVWIGSGSGYDVRSRNGGGSGV